MKKISAQKRRQKILKAAKELFAQKGFEGVTVKTLAQKAGVSEALLYKHFKSKEEIYATLLQEKAKDIEFYFPLNSKDEPKAALTQIAVNFLERNVTDPSFVRVFLFSSLEEHELFEQILLKLKSLFFSQLEELFQKWIDQGKIKNYDVKMLANFFFAQLYYVLLSKTIFSSDDFNAYTLSELANQAVELFLKGVEA